MTTQTPNNNGFKDLKGKAIIMIVFLLCLLVIGLSACSPKVLSRTTNQVQKDSIVTSVNYIHRDTTIIVPGESLELKVPVYSLTEVPTTIRTSNGMNLSLSRINEEILANCNTEDLHKIIALQDKVIKTYESSSNIKTETVEVAVRYIPRVVKIFSLIGIIAVAGGLIYVSIRVGKIL